MKAFAKRCIAGLLSIIMALSISPVYGYAQESAGVYEKVDDLAEFTSGNYVMVVNSGHAVGALDGSWLGATYVTPEDNKIENPDRTLVWAIAVSGSSITLTDANDKMVKPPGGNNNGITAGMYEWEYEYDSTDHSFLIKGVGEDTVTLASNKSSSSRFRAYKNSTVAGNPNSYPNRFTLYKYNASIPSDPVKAAAPIAIPPSGVVASGTAITLSSTTPGSTIQYRVTTATPSAIWLDYTEPIIINSDTTIEAKAMAADYLESDIAVFNYILAKDPIIDPDLEDPITTLPEDAVDIKYVLENTTATSAGDAHTFTTVGQLVYHYGSNGDIDSAILEDVIDGEIYALQVYIRGGLSYNIGDIVKITGKAYQYNGVPQLTSPTVELLTPAAEATTVIQPQEFASLAEVIAAKDSLLSEYIIIRNITLGSYVNNGSTMVKDSLGVELPIYRAAPYPDGVVAGEQVDLLAALSRFRDTWQLRNGTSADYIITNDTKAPIITLPTFESGDLGRDYKIGIIITDNVGVTEATLKLTLGDEPITLPMVQDASDHTIWEATIPGSKLVAGISSFTFEVTASDASGNVAISDVVTIMVVDEPQVVQVTPARNEHTKEEKRPLISVTAANIGEDPTAMLTLKMGDNVVLESVPMTYSEGTFSYTPSENLEDGRYTATVVITRSDSKSITYEWPFTVGTPEYNLYFGQLHSHTTYSDGSGSLDDALKYINSISDKDNIDFVAFTDHSNYFDTTNDANPEASLYDQNLMTATSRSLWNEYKGKIADFNASPSNKGVVALAGFEMTWSGGPGHINTWNTEGIVSRNNKTLNNKSSDAGLKAYYALLSQPEGVDTISQFNHPGTTFGTFSDFAYWDPIIDSRISLIEVGNGEGAIGSGGYFPSYSYYTMALDKGWHLAPTNNQDNHKGKWGNANEARNVIIADDLSEQGIYDALRNHRVYATEDKNLEITYTLNNELMGSIISDVPETLNISVILNDPDDVIQKAEVIANSGRVVHTWNVNAQSKELSASLSPDYSYYYIRVTQKDGDLAVTAPVWVGSTKLLGISNVESSTSTPVTEEALTITTTLFNSEMADATINYMTYKLDGSVIDIVTDGGIIEKGTNAVMLYEFTPTKAKLQTITVEVSMMLEGLEYVFTKDLELDVRDADKLVYIGIDGSHFNEYVAGNYKDSMGNFSLLAAESNVRCVILNTREELLSAARNENGKYKMLIFTAPSRRDGINLRKGYVNYTDEEIAAIKAFSEAGGSIVVCGWSDLYESYEAFPAEDHMAAQQNKLLKAIGASLRISDDGSYDDVLNAGGSEANKARLYLTTYNWDNEFTEGIIYDPENPHDNMYTQRFSHYGGATIHVVDEEENPTSVLPSNVSPIVFGHSSTYSKDCDNDGLGGSSIPRYEYEPGDPRIMILASEIVTHENGTQSLVLVDGAAFMSNFEIQATISDSNAELNYSNYTILQNLIKYVNPTQVDKIADVHKETEEGVKFVVEGIVTSNASGYDRATAFFDCIYIQDETAGINVFPVAGDFRVGQKVRVVGTTSSYQGERQLNVSSITLIDTNLTEVEPITVTAQEINDLTYLGSLVKLSGTIASYESANGAIQTILVRDNAGRIARVFIDGYITTDKEIKNLAVGNRITVIGLSSYDNTFDGLAARIRVRDRADIVCTRKSSPKDPVVTPIPTPTPEPTVSPTPTPTPSPTPVEETVLAVNDAETKVKSGKAYINIEIGEDALKDAGKDDLDIVLSLGKDLLQNILKNSKVKKGVVINLSIPQVEDADIKRIVISKEALQLIKELEQKVTINVEGEVNYTISVPATELKKITSDTEDLNVMLALRKDKKAAKNAVGILSVGAEEELAVGMVVTVPVAKILSLSPGDKVYIYRRNTETGELEEVPNNKKTIDKNGNLKLSTLDGGEFVICTKKVKDAVKLVDKVTVSVKSSVTKGKKLKVNVKLPKELAEVKEFKSGDPTGQEEAKVTYKVNNKSIATVSSKGTITAKKKGKVKLTVTVTLENKDKKTFSKTITVK